MNKELEESIIVLENWLNELNVIFNETHINNTKEREALETTLKELERLQEENKKYKNSYEAAEKIARAYTCSCESIYDVARMAFNVETLQENYISKEKAKESLDNIEDYFERLNGPDEDIEYIKNIKQELLEEK